MKNKLIKAIFIFGLLINFKNIMSMNKKFDESESDPYSGDSYVQLSRACKNCKPETVSVLIERYSETIKKDVNKQDKFGKTPFSWACEKNCKAIVKLLFRHCLDETFDKKDNKGKRPIEWAIQNKNEDIVRWIKERLEKSAQKN
jgi:ankyrin repeat protein